jgi:hypothetical protein
VRKRGKNPTRAQKELLEKLRLNPADWLVVCDVPGRFEIVHRVNEKRRTLDA